MKIITSSVTDPLIPIGSVSLSHQKITALTPASRSQSTWDFSRTHLYAFTPEGTFAISFSAKGAYLTAALIDNRPALGAAIFTPHGVYCAVRGGLAIFTGSRAKDFINLPEDIAGLHYRDADDLILAVASGGNRYWISPAGEVCRIAPVPEFAYEYTFRSAALSSPCTLIVPVLARHIDATLTVCADSGIENAAAYHCATVSVSGESLLPLAVRILTKPPRSRLHLRLEGTADNSLLVSPPFIN